MRAHGEVVLINDIEVLPLSDHEWRVNDQVRAESEGLGVVGFIERRGDAFEATRLGAPKERTSFSELSTAALFLARAS